MEKIGLEAVLNDANFQAGLARYVAGLGKAEKSTQKTAGAMSAFGHTISTALGTAMGILTSQAIPQLVSGLGSFITEAAAAEQTDAALEAVLKSTKGVAGVTADAINDMATALSEMTPFEDDAIKGGQSLLLTFTNIGKDVFPEATEVMLDMSQALGQDLKSSAIQLGKALQDPKDGVTALQRVGVNFNDTQKKMIDQMVKAGKTEQAQKFILKELKTEFGGAAKAAGTTFAGQLKILNNQFGNLKEEIGTALLPILKNMTSFISRTILPIFRRVASEIIPVMVRGLERIGETLNLIVRGFQGDWNPFIEFLDRAFGRTAANNVALFIQSLGGIADGIGKIVASFKSGGLAGGLQEIGAQLGNAFKNIDWTAVSKNLDGLKTKFWTWLTGPGGVLEQVGAQLGKVVAAIGGWLSNSQNTLPIVNAVLGWVEQFWTWLSNPNTGLIATVAVKMEQLIQTMRQWSEAPDTQKKFQEIGKTIARAVLDGIGRVFENPGEGRNLIVELSNTIRSAYEGLRQVFINIGSNIARGVVEGIVGRFAGADMAAQVSSALSGMFNRLFQILSAPGGPIMGLATQIANALLAALKAAWTNVFNAWNPLANAAPPKPPPNTNTPPLPWNGTGEKFQAGGAVHRTGMAFVHAGEYVLNRQQAMAWAPALASTSNVYNFNHTWPAAVPPSQREWTESMVRRVTQQEVRGILGKG